MEVVTVQLKSNLPIWAQASVSLTTELDGQAAHVISADGRVGGGGGGRGRGEWPENMVEP